MGVRVVCSGLTTLLWCCERRELVDEKIAVKDVPKDLKKLANKVTCRHSISGASRARKSSHSEHAVLQHPAGCSPAQLPTLSCFGPSGSFHV
jgi:hypothetical protein